MLLWLQRACAGNLPAAVIRGFKNVDHFGHRFGVQHLQFSDIILDEKKGVSGRVPRAADGILEATFSEHCSLLFLLLFFGARLAVVGSIWVALGSLLISIWLHGGPVGFILAAQNWPCA